MKVFNLFKRETRNIQEQILDAVETKYEFAFTKYLREFWDNEDQSFQGWTVHALTKKKTYEKCNNHLSECLNALQELKKHSKQNISEIDETIAPLVAMSNACKDALAILKNYFENKNKDYLEKNGSQDLASKLNMRSLKTQNELFRTKIKELKALINTKKENLMATAA